MSSPSNAIDPVRLSELGVVAEARVLLANRIQNAFSVLVPLAGTLLGVIAWKHLAPTLLTATVFVAFFLPTAVVIGIGLHRYFTHRAFETGRTLRFLLALFG